MKKLIIVCLLLLSGCTQSNSDDKQLSILSPFGAPSIALMEVMIQQEHNVNLVNGADLLVSSLVKEQVEYDIIIAPINLGLTLINNNQSDYRCLGVVTWGNLYIVSDDKEFDVLNDSFAAFGKGSIPEKIINHVFNDSIAIEYFPSVLDAQAQLLQSKSNAALLAEPIVSATLLQDEKYHVVADLQMFYQEKTGFHNYPQAGLFVHKDSYNDNYELINQVVNEMNEYVVSISNQQDILINDINQLDHQQLGLPKANVVAKAFKAMNIDVQYASEAIDEITAFMNLLDIQVSEEMFVE